jgi:hypothetical protein
MIVYTQPPLFTSKQILGASVMNILRDNDDYFNGVANRPRAIPQGVYRDPAFIGTETSAFVAWEGYHLLQSDATTLHYHFTVTSESAGSHPIVAQLVYDYGGGNQTTIATASGNQTASGSYDLTTDGFSSGFYRVVCYLDRDDGYYNGTLAWRVPYTVYTGSLYYSIGSALVADGNVGYASYFNIWRSNDIFFNAIEPDQIAFAGQGMQYGEYGHDDTDIVLWEGWDCWHPSHYRMGYQCYMSHTTNNNHITIWYDYDDTVNQQHVDITDAGTTADTWTLSSPGSYVEGDWYRVRVTMERDSGGGVNVNSRVDFLYMNAPVADSNYTVMDEFVVNQWGYGDTAGQDTRMVLLNSNDASVYDRLCPTGSLERIDYCSTLPEYFNGISEDPDKGNLYLIRRKDQLYHRTKGATIHKPGGGTEGLTDYDDDNPYFVLDLNSIDLPYGSFYRIEGNELAFAQEM